MVLSRCYLRHNGSLQRKHRYDLRHNGFMTNAVVPVIVPGVLPERIVPVIVPRCYKNAISEKSPYPDPQGHQSAIHSLCHESCLGSWLDLGRRSCTSEQGVLHAGAWYRVTSRIAFFESRNTFGERPASRHHLQF